MKKKIRIFHCLAVHPVLYLLTILKPLAEVTTRNSFKETGQQSSGGDRRQVAPKEPMLKPPATPAPIQPQQLSQQRSAAPDTVEDKTKPKIIKVKLMDDTIKSFLVDQSLSAKDIVATIGQKMSLKNFDEFSLQPEQKPGVLSGLSGCNLCRELAKGFCFPY